MATCYKRDLGDLRTWSLTISRIWARCRPQELSGGQAQRVSLARALCLEPKLFLMDEPLSRLDTPTKEALITLREILCNRSTAIFVTQDRNEALMFCNRLLVLEDGKVMQHGDTMDVFRNPISRSVANFLGIKYLQSNKQYTTQDYLTNCIL